jgi:hypothetical protein
MPTARTKSKALPRADFPEQVGVSSKAISELLDDFERSGIELHSIMILRHGKVAFETWRDPYAPDIPHTMYSVSKSFTSIAIGFAIDEGLLTLDTKVIDIFPEYRPQKYDENLEKLTVFHLLTMTAGKDVSVLENKAKVSWLKSFFGARWAFAPGEDWKYISENCYVMAAIIQKLTGMTVREYLAPRLFKPLGIRENPAWETDPNGLEAGGWGLFITTEELAKVIDCMSHGGKYQGKQVIPEFWAREAGKAQADNSSKSSNQIDSCVGYGFNFWCCHFPGSYRADGMFSQFGIVLPEYDANIITTCSEVFEQKTRDCLWRHFPEGFIEPKDEPEQTTLPMTLTPLPVLTAGRRNPVLEKKLSYSTIHMLYNPVLDVAGFPVSVLPTAVVYMSADRAGNIDKINLDFSENECRFTWSEGKVRNTIVSGLDGKYRKSKMHGSVQHRRIHRAGHGRHDRKRNDSRHLRQYSAQALHSARTKAVRPPGDEINVNLVQNMLRNRGGTRIHFRPVVPQGLKKRALHKIADTQNHMRDSFRRGGSSRERDSSEPQRLRALYSDRASARLVRRFSSASAAEDAVHAERRTRVPCGACVLYIRLLPCDEAIFPRRAVLG